jgi:hypothetical protein
VIGPGERQRAGVAPIGAFKVEAASDVPPQVDPTGAATTASHGCTDLCPEAYPNTMVWVDRPPLTSGECHFDVRFPGWTTDVTAQTLEDAAWAAQEAVLEHAPSETVEVRCAVRQHCAHPAEWIPIWQLM